MVNNFHEKKKHLNAVKLILSGIASPWLQYTSTDGSLVGGTCLPRKTGYEGSTMECSFNQVYARPEDKVHFFQRYDSELLTLCSQGWFQCPSRAPSIVGNKIG